MPLYTSNINSLPALAEELKETHQKLLHALTDNSTVLLTGCAGSSLSFVTAFLKKKLSSSIVILTEDEERARIFHHDLTVLGNDSHFLFLNTLHRDTVLTREDNDPSITQALESLPRKPIIVANTALLTTAVVSTKEISDHFLSIVRSENIQFQSLINFLERQHFERVDTISEAGQYALRGGIIDVFSYASTVPARIEFFGETIESIREFDPTSQRSIRMLDTLTVSSDLVERNESKAETFFDHLNDNSLIILDEPESIEEQAKAIGCQSVLHAAKEKAKVIEYSSLNFFGSNRALPKVKFSYSRTPHVSSSLNTLREVTTDLSSKGYRIIISSEDDTQERRIKNLIEEAEHGGEEWSHIEFLKPAVAQGFIDHTQKLAVFAEHEIFGRKPRPATRRKKIKGFTVRELRQLNIGDYIVHIDKGIGRFAGLQTITVGGSKQECVKLLYEGGDALYVQIGYIDRIQKYSAAEGVEPKLSRLGTAEWERTKARAKKRIKDIARELITLYAKRKSSAGTAFSPDSHWQHELEASFIYDDTPDQAQATEDIKRDMESPTPMDRLICGDVGFGKTEVAIRAAFKAALDGKQVAILVPTTILAEQHYQTFRDRLARFGTRVEVLSRFRSKAEQKKIVEALSAGQVDIIIGTHRILSKDVVFKDLGLVIIDEEHRFGVTAKEKLRVLRTSVDTLTLTATPIPRTLNFSLLGARDLSLIATPPPNRLPVSTEIGEVNDELLTDAIRKELARNGQIYIVNDKIHSIDILADRIRSCVPEARLVVAHGQMSGAELEDAMMQFLERKIDVLLATKIIESGLDIPNANTIIINHADRFGMAELYQLRGRVGRSNVQAYCYLLVPSVGTLTTNARRRLEAIEEFSELGSGMNLALRDLEIRGAGNLLGAEQSGFIVDVGFELYQRIVEEAVHELKEQEFSSVFAENLPHEKNEPRYHTTVHAEIDAYLPKEYVQNDTDRFEFYRHLSEAVNEKDLISITEELRDRFGPLPTFAENLIHIVAIRIAASTLGFRSATITKNSLRLEFPPQDTTTQKFYDELFPKIITAISQRNSEKMKLVSKKSHLLDLVITLTNLEQGPKLLYELAEELDVSSVSNVIQS